MVWISNTSKRISTWLVLGLALLCCGELCSGDALAQTSGTGVANNGKLKLETTAAALASSQAAFFNSSLNLREEMIAQYESGLIGSLRQVPYIQDLEVYLKEKWDNPDQQTRQVKSFLTGRIARDILALLSDMVAQECFVIGEAGWTKFALAISEFQYEMARLSAEDPDAMREQLLSITKERIDDIPIPTTIIGFQLTDDANARDQLDQLEGILQLALSQVEPLRPFARQLKHNDLSNGQTLTMTFEAKDIPWDDIPAPNEDAQDVIDHVADLLEGRKVVLSIGVVDNRLMMCLSESANTLAELGKATSLLTTSAFKHLIKNQPDKLLGIQFNSGSFRDAAVTINFGNYFQRMALQMTKALEAQFDSDEFQDWQEQLLDDCEWLDDKIAEMLPKFSDMLTYAFRTDDGIESFAYDWTPNWLLENARPLGVAAHGGTRPLLLLAQRQLWPKQGNEILNAVIEALPRHAESLSDSGILDDEQAEKFNEMTEKVLPIIDKVLKAIGEKLAPGMDQNESLFVVTAQTMVTELSEYAPPPPAPLPLPEMAWAVKLKNRDLFLAGCDQIVEAINDTIALMREQNAGRLPADLQVPAASEESLANGGKRYSFPNGAPAPWDQFEVQMAINNEVAILGYSTRQVRDMYEARPLAARPAWYSDSEPTAGVGFIDFAGIVSAVHPWIHYSLANINEDMDAPLGEPDGDVPVPSGSDILQIWDCFKKLGKAAGTTAVDNQGATVSHWISVGE